MPELYRNIKFENSNYIPQFVGSNFDTLKATADALDTRYRENRAMTDKIAIAAANDMVLAADEPLKQARVAAINNTLSEVAASPENFENSSAIVNKMARDYLTDQDRLFSLENYKRAEQAKQLERTYGAEALNFGDKADQFSTVHPETGQRRLFNVGVEKRADYSGKMQQLLGKVADDGYTTSPTGQTIRFNESERNLIKSGQVNLLSPQKVNALVEGLIPSYRNSAEGTQDIRRLTGLEGIQETPIEVPMYDKKGKVIGKRETTALEEDIRQRFRAVAAPQVFQKNFQKWDDFGIPAAKGAGDIDPNDIPYTPTRVGSPKQNPSLINPTEAGEARYDPKTNKWYKDKLKPYTSPLGPSLESVAEEVPAPAETQKQYEHVVNNATPRQKKLIEQQGKSYTFKDHVERRKEAANKAKEVVESGDALTKDTRPIYQDFLDSDGLNAPAILEGESEPKTLKEIINNDLDLDSKDKVEVIPTLLNRASPNPKMGANLEAIIKVNGRPVKGVVVRLSDQVDAASAEMNDILQNSYYAGQDKYTPDTPFVSSQRDVRPDGVYVPVYYTTTVENPSGKYPFDTEIHVGEAKLVGEDENGPIIEGTNFNDKETYTTQQFKTLMGTISKKQLNKVYGSGQMKDTDLKTFVPKQ